MLSSYLRVIRRRWYVLPAMILLAGCVLMFAANHWVTVTSRVIVPFPGDQNNQNFQSIATSQAVAAAVIQDLHMKGKSPGQLLGQVSVALEFNTNVYDVSVRDTSKGRAIRIDNAWVKETTALYTKLNTAPAALAYIQAEQQLGSMQQKIATLQQQVTVFEYQHPELVNLQTTANATNTSHNSTSSSGSSSASNSSTQQTPLSGGNGASTTTGSSGAQSSTSGSATQSGNSSTTTQINNTPGHLSDAETLNYMRTQLNNDLFDYNQLSQVLSNTQLGALASQQLAFAQVLDTASVPNANTTLLLVFTLALGLLLGLGTIFVWEYFDHGVSNPRGLEQVFEGVTVLPIATVPTQRELRHVATGTWSEREPAVATTATSRPGVWPALLALAASSAASSVATQPHDGEPAPGDASQAQQNGHNGPAPATHQDGSSADADR
ncbi:MAG: hypothetical protein ACHQ4H_00130 [Ktedonobacterales bacterium]